MGSGVRSGDTGGEPSPAGGDAPVEPLPGIGGLPESVRTVLIGWAASAVGTLSGGDLPSSLARVAHFAPAKRARAGARHLAQAIGSDAAFRAILAGRVPGPAAGTQTPAAVAARAWLLQLPGTAQSLAAAAQAEQEHDLAGRLAALTEQNRVLAGELAVAISERDAARDELTAAAPQAIAEAALLRRRLSEQGNRLRQAETGLGAAKVRADAEIAELRTQIATLRSDLDAATRHAAADRRIAEECRAELGRARAAADQGRADADHRVELLLSTIDGAATGLRSELRLSGGGADPAELVARSLPGQAGADALARTADPTRLAGWLMLPRTHLIVDGYNVSKTGYPQLSLADQRDRLIRSLAALGARTSAEITVVFDGSGVTVPAPPTRGTRVLFSPAGVIADDVIRDLVRAEPPGRVVVVVTSDREVMTSVGRSGARTAPSPALLALLGGGM